MGITDKGGIDLAFDLYSKPDDRLAHLHRLYAPQSSASARPKCKGPKDRYRRHENFAHR